MLLLLQQSMKVQRSYTPFPVVHKFNIQMYMCKRGAYSWDFMVIKIFSYHQRSYAPDTTHLKNQLLRYMYILYSNTVSGHTSFLRNAWHSLVTSSIDSFRSIPWIMDISGTIYNVIMQT